jgi:hypothetical protein
MDTFEEQCAAMRAIQRFHMDTRGWDDIGYNYVAFQPYGNRKYARIFEGRGWDDIPAAQEYHNTDTVACAVMGMFDGLHELKDNTRWAITLLYKWVDRQVGGTMRTLGGHRDVVATSCPGDDLYRHIPTIARNANLRVYNRAMDGRDARDELKYPDDAPRG